MKNFIVLYIASPGHKLIIPGNIKTDAGNLYFLANSSERIAIIIEDIKLAKYILPKLFNMNL